VRDAVAMIASTYCYIVHFSILNCHAELCLIAHAQSCPIGVDRADLCARTGVHADQEGAAGFEPASGAQQAQPRDLLLRGTGQATQATAISVDPLIICHHWSSDQLVKDPHWAGLGVVLSRDDESRAYSLSESAPWTPQTLR